MNTHVSKQSTDSVKANDLVGFVQKFKRRRKLFATVCLLLTLITFLLATLLPAYYQSTATILIEQQEIPNDLVRTTISSYADQRLQMIEQRVMTRENLLRIVSKYDLYADQRDRMPVEELLRQIGSNITIEVVSGQFIDPRRGIPTKATIAFELGFTDRSADKAFKVANELYTLYHEENLRNRNQLVRETSSFLESEADKLNLRVQELEATLAEFKQAHINELPELLEVNWQMLNRTDEERQDVERQRRNLQDRVLMLEADLALLNPYEGIVSETGARILSPADRLSALQAELAQVQARYSAEHPDIQRIKSDISSLEAEVSTRDQHRALVRELESGRAQLAAIQERYSQDHPDVVLLTGQIEGLVKQLDNKVQASSVELEPTNPAYIQMRTRLDTARLELESLDRRSSEIEQRRSNLEARISRTPSIERQFREIAREYTNAATKFQEVKAKQLEAELAESLEQEQKGEKFTLIDPPAVAETPVSPNRMLILILGTLVALSVSFGTVMAADALDHRVFGDAMLTQIVGVPISASVPVIISNAQRRKARLQQWFWGGGAIGAAACLLVAVHLLVFPIDAAVAILLNRYGFS